MPRDAGGDAASIVRALRLYHRHATDVDQEVAALAGLAPSDVRCLDALDLAGGRMTAGDLARAVHLSTGAVTGALDRLERAGVARRVPDDADRRRVVVELDVEARERGRRSYAAVVDAERAHLDHLDEAQLRVLRDFLEAEASWVQHQAADLRAGRRRSSAAARAGRAAGD